MEDPQPIGRAIDLTLKRDATYLGVACKSCGAPVVLAILKQGFMPRSPLLGTAFLIACGDVACSAAHTYGQADICRFRWPGRK